MSDTRYTEIRTADDVTDEVLELAWSMVEGWYLTTAVDWEDVLYRMEKSTLKDGTHPDLGGSMDSPAIRKVKRVVRQWRKEATE